MATITNLGGPADYRGYLVRDDYAGRHQLDAQLAGIQRCKADLIRQELRPIWQKYASGVVTVWCEAGTTVTVRGRDHLNLALLAERRQSEGHGIGWGMTTNQHRDWAKGNHSGHIVAERLHDRAD